MAGLAVQEKIKGQLRRLYSLTLSKASDYDYIEAFIRYQIARGLYGYRFGEKVLSILKEYKEEMGKFRRVLEYAIMLHGYLDLKDFMGLKPKIRDVVQQTYRRYGVGDVELSAGREEKRITVALSDFFGDPRQLGEEIRRQVYRNIPETRKYKFRIWIEKRR